MKPRPPLAPAPPGVTVVVTVWEPGESLYQTLAEIRRQARGLEEPVEILLAVNRPEEEVAGGRARLEESADRLLFVPEPGKSRALNAAVEAARHEILAFTDDDARPGPRWLERLVEPFRSEAAADLAGTAGRVWPVLPAGGAPAWYRHLISGRHSFFLGPWHDLGPRPLDYPPREDRLPLGANCAFRRSLLRAFPYPVDLGPNRLTGLRGGEDTLVALRIVEAGWRLRYVPTAVVVHPVEPGRLDPKWILEGFYVQGREIARLRHLQGRRPPRAGRLRRSLLRHRVKGFLYGLLGHPRRLRHRLRSAWLQGILDEAAGRPPRKVA